MLLLLSFSFQWKSLHGHRFSHLYFKPRFSVNFILWRIKAYFMSKEKVVKLFSNLKNLFSLLMSKCWSRAEKMLSNQCVVTQPITKLKCPGDFTSSSDSFKCRIRPVSLECLIRQASFSQQQSYFFLLWYVELNRL